MPSARRATKTKAAADGELPGWMQAASARLDEEEARQSRRRPTTDKPSGAPSNPRKEALEHLNRVQPQAQPAPDPVPYRQQVQPLRSSAAGNTSRAATSARAESPVRASSAKASRTADACGAVEAAAPPARATSANADGSRTPRCARFARILEEQRQGQGQDDEQLLPDETLGIDTPLEPVFDAADRSDRLAILAQEAKARMRASMNRAIADNATEAKQAWTRDSPCSPALATPQPSAELAAQTEELLILF